MNRFEVNFHILKDWLSLRQQEKTLLPWFTDNLVQTVGIYGLGSIGELLEEELAQTDVLIAYGIDYAANEKRKRFFPVYGTECGNYPEVDAIIVTTVSIYWEIVELLKNKTSVPIVSLDDVISYCLSVRGKGGDGGKSEKKESGDFDLVQ